MLWGSWGWPGVFSKDLEGSQTNATLGISDRVETMALAFLSLQRSTTTQYMKAAL